jgi:arylsulfatase A-like enzyme
MRRAWLAAGWGLAALAASGCSGSRRAPAPASVVLVTIDTLRADHLGFAGYPRDTSPNLDGLARAATWFPRCYSVSATTGASHASLFTSRYPYAHGVLANRQELPELPSLMSALRARGYLAAAFVSSVVVGRQFGVQRQFDHFDDDLRGTEATRPERAERDAGQTVSAALRFLETRPRDRPLFLWLHLIDPHGPYLPPEDPDRYLADRRVAPVSMLLPLGTWDWPVGELPRYQVLDGRRDADFYAARYDAEIRYADSALGRFFGAMEGLGLGGDTLLAVTADHGETLADSARRRYFTHGVVAYEEVARVPLVVRAPAGQARLQASRDRLVTLLDVAPTLLDLLGVEAPAGFQGRSLLRAAPEPDAPIFTLGAYGSELLEKRIGTQFSLRRGAWTYVLNSADGREELYDRSADPHETRDAAGAEPQRFEALRRELRAFLDRPARTAAPVKNAPGAEDKLRSLGYAN